MNSLWLERLGNWNPQLLRELKGRCKPRHVMIAVAITLLGQVLLLMSFASQLPVNDLTKGIIRNKYCNGDDANNIGPVCLLNNVGSFEINWPLWWLDVFVFLSIISFFALLVIGTHMLISDLSREEHRGTLNFIRLSPQSTASILSGKLLGVPILLYLLVGLAIPLHLWAGLSAQIPIALILGFYGVVIVSAACFWSASLLYGLVTVGLVGFQAWLGSGAVLVFLTMMTSMTMSDNPLTSNSIDWLHLFSPSVMLPYLINASHQDHSYKLAMSHIEGWKWFFLPLGASVWSVASFSVINYGLGTYWVWQGLKRCFHKPSATLLKKQQSYWLTTSFEVAVLGFAIQLPAWRNDDYLAGLFDNFGALLLLNLPLFLCLIAALSPHRQVLQDWSRYKASTRKQKKGTRKSSSSLLCAIQDLIWGEKSPSLVAVAINLAIAASMVVSWILLWPESEYKIPALLTVLLSVNLFLIYTCIAQLMLFMKTPKRTLWATFTVTGLIVLPPIVFSLLSITPDKLPGMWLFSVFSWMSVREATTATVLMALMGQYLILTLSGLQLRRQLRRAGESASIAILAGRPSLRN